MRPAPHGFSRGPVHGIFPPNRPRASRMIFKLPPRAVAVRTLRKPADERSTATYLTVWPQGGVNPGVPAKWVVQQDGWTGYRLWPVSSVGLSSG
ncbi:hypothetical protein GCM10020366_19180 [Saccharopolyspora gregorii]|uniref:Uncharacterized protein n=2 Tax=Saccharopolyspora gregorii TaxID=33914 RepID=A0ABP6RLT0_9PSEU